MAKPRILRPEIEFRDESLPYHPFEGDLAYGRINSKDPTSRRDVSARRNKDGIPKNRPVAKLTLVRKRSSIFWEKDSTERTKLKKAKYKTPKRNTMQFQALVAGTYIQYLSSNILRANFHIKVDNLILKNNEKYSSKLRRLLR